MSKIVNHQFVYDKVRLNRAGKKFHFDFGFSNDECGIVILSSAILCAWINTPAIFSVLKGHVKLILIQSTGKIFDSSRVKGSFWISCL